MNPRILRQTAEATGYKQTTQHIKGLCLNRAGLPHRTRADSLSIQSKQCSGSAAPRNETVSAMKKIFLTIFTCTLMISSTHLRITKRSYSDQSVHGYMTERTCWWNEVCKEEFQNMFRCKCPQWSYCRSPGRYYNAYCSMTNTGYIWTQPTWDWGP